MKIIFFHIYLNGELMYRGTSHELYQTSLKSFSEIAWPEQLWLSCPDDSHHPRQLGLPVLCSFFLPCLSNLQVHPGIIMYLDFSHPAGFVWKFLRYDTDVNLQVTDTNYLRMIKKPWTWKCFQIIVSLNINF